MLYNLEAHGFFTVDMKPRPDVWTASVAYRAGTEVYLCSTRELALKALCRWARNYWDELDTDLKPENFTDETELVVFYFNTHRIENYSIQQRSIDAFLD